MYAAAKYASVKIILQPVSGRFPQGERCSSERPYVQGSRVVALLLERLQEDGSLGAVRTDTAAEKLWLAAARGRV